MQVVFSVVGVVLCFNSVCPVTSNVFDESMYPKMNTVSLKKYGGVIKKRYSENDLISKHERTLEHAPNIRHHDLKKTSAFTFGPAYNWNAASRQNQKVNQPLTTPEMTPERNRPQEERPRYDTNVKTAGTQIQPEVKDRPVTIQEEPNRAAFGDNHQNRYMEHQARSAFFKRLGGPHKERYEMFKVMDVNVNKVPLKADYQNKFNRGNGRYNNMPPISMNRVPNHYRRMPPALKSMQKLERYADRNSPLMYKMLDEMTRRVPETMIKKYDSRKRETKGAPRDNIVKYVHNKRGKDYLKTVEVVKNLDNSDETDIKTNDMPYAVFYRMNPVSMDYQTDIVVDTFDDGADSYKGKTASGDNVILVTNHEPLQEGNVRLHNKIKSFVNFKKH